MVYEQFYTKRCCCAFYTCSDLTVMMLIIDFRPIRFLNAPYTFYTKHTKWTFPAFCFTVFIGVSVVCLPIKIQFNIKSKFFDLSASLFYNFTPNT